MRLPLPSQVIQRAQGRSLTHSGRRGTADAATSGWLTWLRPVYAARRLRATTFYAWAAGALILGGVALRLLLMALGWPQTNSDESTMGLMALHIAAGKDYPGFFYGQSYMGPLQAYLAAPLFRLVGPSIFTLRLSMLLLCTVFLLNMYVLTALLYTRKLALITLAVLGLDAPVILSAQITAIGRYGEVLCFGSGLLLIATWLALGSRPVGERLRVGLGWRRTVSFGAWGLVAGLAVWSDLLLPFVGLSGLLLLRWCGRELRQWRVWCLVVLAFVLGAFPQIAYNLTAAPGQNSFSVLIGISQAGGVRHESRLLLVGQQLAGTLLITLPNATEANPLCPINSQAVWPLTAQSSLQTIGCSVVRMGWGLGVLVLWAVAAVLAVGTLRALRRRNPSDEWVPSDRHSAVQQTARLAVLGSAGLTLLLYALSSVAARVPWGTTHYLLGLLIAVPADLAPLWPESYPFKLLPRAARAARMLWRGRYVPLALLALTLTLGTSSTFQLVKGTQHLTHDESALIADLLRIGATRVYTDYWTCYRIAFQSRERIVCDVLDEHLQAGMNRYRPYVSLVRADPHAAYVFLPDSPQATALGARPDIRADYHRLTFDRYVVYQPYGQGGP